MGWFSSRRVAFFPSILGSVLASAAVQAGAPPTPQSMPTAPSAGFLNFQSLGFLPMPAPANNYCAPNGGQACVTAGASTSKGFYPKYAWPFNRFGAGAGIYPYGFGYGYVGVTPLYAWPSYYYDTELAYPAAVPLGWNQSAYRYPPPAAATAPPSRGDTAEIMLRVPPDAEVWIEGVKMQQQGSVRRYVSTRLDAGQLYAYEIRAVWMEAGRPAEQILEVNVRAGDRLNLTFASGSGRRTEAVRAPAP